MIVGSGLLARAFHTRYAGADGVTIFASGVSNSLESDPSAFAREQRLLEQLLAGEAIRFVYFGSCGVLNQEEMTPYMQHKKRMEELVLNHPGGLVLRLPQVIGNTRNPNTLTNFIHNKISGNETFSIWKKAERNLVDIDDIVAIGSAIIDDATYNKSFANIAANRSTQVLEIVRIFERVLQRKARYVVEDRGSELQIDSQYASTIAIQLGLNLGDGYVERVIRKYYVATSDA